LTLITQPDNIEVVARATLERPLAWEQDSMSIPLQAKDISLNLKKGLCKYCGSDRIVKAGTRKLKSGTKQQYQCNDCGHRFINPDKFPDVQTDKETIALALDLYFEGLSLRKTARQIKKLYKCNISDSTISKWIKKYAPLVKKFTDALQPDVAGGDWHNDETLVKLRKPGDKNYYEYYWGIKDGKSRYFITGFLSGRKRGKKEAYQLYRTARQIADGVPDAVFCDGCASYETGFHRALCQRGGRVALHQNVGISTGEHNNNRIERHWNYTKGRTKTMRGLQRGVEVMDGLAIHYNFIRPHQTFKGQTPAQRAGIDLPFEDGWGNLIDWSMRFETIMKGGS